MHDPMRVGKESLMKKTVFLLVALLLLSAVLMTVSCGKATQTTFKPDGKSEGTLKLGFDASYPPYGYLDTETKQYAGFDIEYAKLVCNRLNLTLELVPIDWNQKDNELKSGNIDCIWNGFTYEGREADYTWSDRYLDNTIVVLVKSDSGIASLKDLAGKTVSVQTGSSGESALKNNEELVGTFKGGTYLTCPDYTQGFNELKAGSFEALVIDEAVAKYLVAGKTEYRILEETVNREQYGVGFRLGNTELRDKINATMKEIAAEGTVLKELAEKYGIAPEAILIGN